MSHLVHIQTLFYFDLKINQELTFDLRPLTDFGLLKSDLFDLSELYDFSGYKVKAGFHMIADDRGSQIVCDHMVYGQDTRPSKTKHHRLNSLFIVSLLRVCGYAIQLKMIR